MKKFLKVLFLACVIVIICICFFSCSPKSENLIKSKISDNRLGIFCDYNEVCYAEYTYGYREEPFIYDGISENKKELGVFIVHFLKETSFLGFKAQVKYNDTMQEVIFEKSPFDNSFGVDIEKIIDDEEIELTILETEYKNTKIVLKNESNKWTISNEKAREIATNHFSTDLQNLINSKSEDYECYLKIMSNHTFKQYFWYFSYLSTKGQKKHIVIDINSGEIVVENFEY